MLSGCEMAANTDIRLKGEATDESGDHRLLLKFVETRHLDRWSNENGSDFHSLVWETRADKRWSPKVTITQSDFQQDAVFRRWVHEIQSLKPDTGFATIQVGEEGVPDDAGTVHVTYSWREWDLNLNKELRTIKVCQSPFEKLDAMPNNGK